MLTWRVIACDFLEEIGFQVALREEGHESEREFIPHVGVGEAGRQEWVKELKGVVKPCHDYLTAPSGLMKV